METVSERPFTVRLEVATDTIRFRCRLCDAEIVHGRQLDCEEVRALVDEAFRKHYADAGHRIPVIHPVEFAYDDCNPTSGPAATLAITWRELASIFPQFVQWAAQRGPLPDGEIREADYSRLAGEFAALG